MGEKNTLPEDAVAVIEIKEVNGSHDENTIYKVGRLTRPDKYDPNQLEECSHGIHFFISKQEALDW